MSKRMQKKDREQNRSWFPLVKPWKGVTQFCGNPKYQGAEEKVRRRILMVSLYRR